MRLILKVAAVVIVLAVAFSLFAAAFSTNRFFLFSNELTVQSPYSGKGYQDQYVSEINNSDVRLGEVAIIFNEAPNASLHRAWIDVSHYNNTLLDKIVFKFTNPSSNTVISVYTKATNPQININSYNQNGVTTVTVNPSEVMQRGTLHFDFVIENFGAANKIQVSTELTLHTQAFVQLTQMKAELSIEHSFL